MTAVALDTNILLRLVHTESPEHQVCQNGVRDLAELGAEFVIVPQVAVELWVVATRPTEVNGLGWQPSFVRSMLDQILLQVAVLPESTEAFARWIDIVTFKQVRGKRAHDARIAATLAANGVRHLLTLNAQDFTGFPDLVAIHPARIGLMDLPSGT